MTRAIRKYRIRIQGLQYVSMPASARLLGVQVEGRKAYLIAEVDLDTSKRKYLIRTYVTGELLDADEQEYVGSFRIPGRRPYYHVYRFCDDDDRVTKHETAQEQYEKVIQNDGNSSGNAP